MSFRSLAELTFHQNVSTDLRPDSRRAAVLGSLEGILLSALVTLVVWNAVNMIAAMSAPKNTTEHAEP